MVDYKCQYVKSSCLIALYCVGSRYPDLRKKTLDTIYFQLQLPQFHFIKFLVINNLHYEWCFAYTEKECKLYTEVEN